MKDAEHFFCCLAQKRSVLKNHNKNVRHASCERKSALLNIRLRLNIAVEEGDASQGGKCRPYGFHALKKNLFELSEKKSCPGEVAARQTECSDETGRNGWA
ncbi:MAG: hypothetical protein K5657_07955 [Desulfovibrio sp.]|nr:hypothetical protein [Desulfovibrio sp.]